MEKYQIEKEVNKECFLSKVHEWKVHILQDTLSVTGACFLVTGVRDKESEKPSIKSHGNHYLEKTFIYLINVIINVNNKCFSSHIHNSGQLTIKSKMKTDKTTKILKTQLLVQKSC